MLSGRTNTPLPTQTPGGPTATTQATSTHVPLDSHEKSTDCDLTPCFQSRGYYTAYTSHLLLSCSIAILGDPRAYRSPMPPHLYMCNQLELGRSAGEAE